MIKILFESLLNCLMLYNITMTKRGIMNISKVTDIIRKSNDLISFVFEHEKKIKGTELDFNELSKHTQESVDRVSGLAQEVEVLGESTLFPGLTSEQSFELDEYISDVVSEFSMLAEDIESVRFGGLDKQEWKDRMEARLETIKVDTNKLMDAYEREVQYESSGMSIQG